MRKHLIIFIFILFCFPFCVKAKDNIYISHVKVEDQSENAKEVEAATYDQLTLSFHVSFSYINDFIRYKVTIRNDSNNDYELKDDSIELLSSDSILYQFDFEDDSRVVRANSFKNIFITASYMKEVGIDQFVEGQYRERNQKNINFLNNAIFNPNMEVPYSILFFAIIISLIGFYFVISNRRYLRSFCGIILIFFSFLPVLVYAREKFTLHFDSKVDISSVREFCYIENSNKKYFEYTVGTIMNDYVLSHLDFEVDEFHYHEGKISNDMLNDMLSYYTDQEYTDFQNMSEDDYYSLRSTLEDEEMDAIDNLYSLYHDHSTKIFIHNPILDKTVGCYYKTSS